MTGWCSGYSADIVSSAMFCQLDCEFESHPVHFLILFQNFEKLSSKIGVSSNLVWAQKTSYPTIAAHSALVQLGLDRHLVPCINVHICFKIPY